MEKKDRLAKAIAYLKLQGLVESQVDAARKMNASESTMSSAIRGNEKYLNNTFLRRFNDAFGGIFSLKWLIDGIGSMCCSDVTDEDIFGGSHDKGSEDVKDERIKLLEERIAFLEEQVEFYKNKK
jgi:hypothetical protein